LLRGRINRLDKRLADNSKKMSREDKRGKGCFWLLAGLVLAFLALRLAVLFSSLDELYEEEELYRGTVAKEIIQGPLIPLWEYLDYRVEYFPGGTLVVGILAVPFFLLFGQTYIALKSVGLSFALGTFVLWYLFLRRFFNSRTALLSALLFIFCVPFYTKTSLITWGAHPEANFFTILNLFIFYIIFFGKDSGEDVLRAYKEKKKYFFILGAVSGFGLWFVQTYLLTIAFSFLFWFAFDQVFFRRKAFLIYCLGFLIGFSPAIYYGLFYNASILQINGRNPLVDVLLCDFQGAFFKLSRLMAYELPASFLFPDFFRIPGIFLSYSYYAIFIITLICLLWFNRKGLLVLAKSLAYPITLKKVEMPSLSVFREQGIIIYPLLFFLAYALSGYSLSPVPWKEHEMWSDYIGYRYLIPVVPFIFAIVGIFADKIAKKSALPAGILLIVTMGTGLIGNISLVSLNKFGRFFADKGYSYNIIGDKVGLRVKDNLGEYLEPFEKLEGDFKRQFYEGLGSGLAWRLREEGINEVTKIFDREIKTEYHPSLYKGWGIIFSPDYSEEYARAIAVGGVIPEEYRPFFYEGFGRNMNFFDNPPRIAETIAMIGREFRPYCYIGLGYRIGFELKFDPRAQKRLLNSIDKDYREYVEQGMLEGGKWR